MKTEIIMEDEHMIVCRKPAGIATQTDKIGQKDVLSELKNYIKRPYIGMIHRLDQPVEGLLVFAKTQGAAAKLSKQIANNQMRKKYYAVVAGKDLSQQGVLIDYLKKDGKTNSSCVVNENEKDAKRAELSYQVIKRKDNLALIEVTLVTGRHHQIRVQMSHAGYPLLGDNKYGNDISVMLSEQYQVKNIALCAYSLEFQHPATGNKLIYTIEPAGSIFNEFGKRGDNE